MEAYETVLVIAEDGAKKEAKATGTSFRDIANVFRTLSTDQPYYFDVIRDQVFPPKGTLGVSSTTTRSRPRFRSQFLKFMSISMEADATKAVTVIKEGAMASTVHFASDHLKALVTRCRIGRSEGDETDESNWRSKPSRSRAWRRKQASRTMSEVKVTSVETERNSAKEVLK